MNFNYTQQHDRLLMYQLRYLQVPIDLKNDNLIIIKRANPYASTGQGRAGPDDKDLIIRDRFMLLQD